MLKAIGEGRYPLLLEIRVGYHAIERPYKLTESTQAKVFYRLMWFTQIESGTAIEAWGRDYPRGGYHYTFAGPGDELIQVAIPAPHQY